MWEEDVDDGLVSRGYELEFEYGTYGFDWEITKIYTKDRRVFSLTDSGCSCSSFGAAWDDVDEAEGSLFEVTELPSVADAGRFTESDIHTVREKLFNLGVR